MIHGGSVYKILRFSKLTFFSIVRALNMLCSGLEEIGLQSSTNVEFFSRNQLQGPLWN